MRVPGFVVLIGTVCVLGCSSPPPKPALPPLVPVHGKVLFRGKPLEGVAVAFNPLFDMGSVKFIPAGTTTADGTFTLVSGQDGAPVGEYAVTFTYPEPWDPQEGGTPVDRWRGKYGSPAKSKFKVKVVDGPNELDPFKLD